MKALLQRVTAARVEIDQQLQGGIGRGLLVLLGVGKEDGEEDGELLAGKISQLRVFEDDAGKMNRSVVEAGGELLVVSQFTLWASCRKGRRPSFTDAAAPELAERLYEAFLARLRQLGLRAASGRFGADMQVHLVNDGPVTIMLDTDDLRAPPLVRRGNR